jgi:hypothetical protein
MTLRPLKDLGLVAVVQHRREHFDPRKWLSPFVYWELNILTAKGARALNDWFVDRGVSGAVFWHKGLKETVQGYGAHDLEIINAGVTLHAAASLEGYLLNDWLRDRDFRSQAARGAFIPFLEPDAAITLGKDDRLYPFFIEIDRGTTPSVGEQDNAWQTKMRSYARALRDYYRRSPFFDTQIPPRVLTITTNAARLEALRTATRRAEGKDTYLFTLRSSLDPIFIPKRDPAGATLLAENGEALQEKTAPDTLGPIWVTPDDDEPRALRDYLRPRSLTA